MAPIKENKKPLNITIMNKILMTAAGSTLGSGSYESPVAKVAEIHSEGVLCASTLGATLSVEEWETKEFTW